MFVNFYHLTKPLVQFAWEGRIAKHLVGWKREQGSFYLRIKKSSLQYRTTFFRFSTWAINK
jgi:hypothetical protein